ncbi:hypothetical protein [Roseibium sp. LAB1]
MALSPTDPNTRRSSHLALKAGAGFTRIDSAAGRAFRTMTPAATGI